MPTPRSWGELEQRLAAVFAGSDGEAAATARDILVQAVAARWGVESLRDLTRTQRQIALQKSIGLTLAFERDVEGDLAFCPSGARDIVRGIVARFFDGAAIDGPPWRLDPSETDRPNYSAWAALPF